MTSPRCTLGLALVWSWLAAMVPAQAAAKAARWLATETLGALTPTSSLAPIGLAGTDLGISVPIGDRLVFLFGDSWTLDRRERDVDSWAFADRTPLPTNQPPRLRWATRPNGRFAPLLVPDTSLGGMDVPVGAVVIDGRIQVFCSSGFDKRSGIHSHSACATAKGDQLDALMLAHRVASAKFVNVSIAIDAGFAWIFGTGPYRKSSVYLARVAPSSLTDRAAWRYWPQWAATEASVVRRNWR